MDELVFAIPTTELWNLLTYNEQGLILGNSELLNRIIDAGQFRKRKELEEDPSFKQIIPYAIISYLETGQNKVLRSQSYYLFKRTSKQTENRLHNQLTLGVGGHMNPRDSLEPKDQYLIEELKREFFEEVKLFGANVIKDIEFLGFINDDTIAVGRVHIGLLYHIIVSNNSVSVNEPDKMTAEWVEKQNLVDFYEGMETWTQIAYDNCIK